MQAAQKSRQLSSVIVATDDRRISEAVRRYGGQVFLSENEHATGSDRVAEAASRLECDFVLNIQGDEPFLSSDVIDAVIGALDKETVVMSSACSPLGNSGEADNPNVVKVVLDKNGDALYFSRSRIPYNLPGVAAAPVYRHIGIYGFKRDFLLKFASLERTPLEISENLEQLRALEHGYKIRVITVKSEFVGIDSADDLPKAERILNQWVMRNDKS